MLKSTKPWIKVFNMKSPTVWVAGFVVVGAIMCLVGCGKKATPDIAPPTTEVTGVIPDYQLKALEKAKSVEGMLDKHVKERQEKMDQ